MGSTESMVVFVEVHHLEPTELVGDLLDLVLLTRLLGLDAGGVPTNVVRHFCSVGNGMDTEDGRWCIVYQLLK
jgi:hypothetical protein